MGMHYGVVAAEMDLPTLIQALELSFGRFERKGPLSRDDQLVDLLDKGFMAGEFNGKVYVFDRSFLLATNSDVLAKIAADTGRLVVSYLGESVSGTYEFFAARGTQLIRYYSHCYSAISRPFEIGDPLPGEKDNPLDKGVGAGLLAAFNSFGFDYEGWEAHGAKYAYFYISNAPMKIDDGLQVERSEHHRKFALAKLPPAPEKKSRLQRFFTKLFS
jgi:hypothetical protein